MNNALEDVKRNFKPYRYTKKKNVTIIESTKGSYVIKEKENDNVGRAYNYLLSRNFDYFPRLNNEIRGDVNVFEYIEDIETPREQKALDMVEIVALLHNKTTFYKEVTEDKYKEIYENLKSNISYAKNFYDNKFNMIIEEVMPSPSDYLLMRNIYKIFEALEFCSAELDNWYDSVKNDLKTRVAFIHNNLETEHYIENSKGYLISWDKARVDSPVLDLITFYQREYMNLDFEPIFKKYFQSYPLTDNEKRLLFIVLSIPPTKDIVGSELELTHQLRKQLDYIFKTEKLISSFRVNAEEI